MFAQDLWLCLVFRLLSIVRQLLGWLQRRGVIPDFEVTNHRIAREKRVCSLSAAIYHIKAGANFSSK